MRGTARTSACIVNAVAKFPYIESFFSSPFPTKTRRNILKDKYGIIALRRKRKRKPNENKTQFEFGDFVEMHSCHGTNSVGTAG